MPLLLKLFEKDLRFFCPFARMIRLVEHGGCRQAVKAPDCGSGIRGFESHHPPHFGLNLKGFLLRGEKPKIYLF
jgi:hypothetical protein